VNLPYGVKARFVSLVVGNRTLGSPLVPPCEIPSGRQHGGEKLLAHAVYRPAVSALERGDHRGRVWQSHRDRRGPACEDPSLGHRGARGAICMTHPN
jgi:hypothetical protein